MTKAHKKKAAARARAAKEQGTSASTLTLVPPNGCETINGDPVIEVDSDSDDCGYEGGVNYVWSESEDSEYQLETEDEWLDVDENLQEMDEDDLPPIKVIPAMFTNSKLEVDWKNVEKNRSLGYTGTSERTMQRQAQKAREREVVRQEAKTS